MSPHRLLILCCLLACLVSGQRLAEVNSGIGELSFELLKTYVKGNENTVHSGFSIVSALGMCLLGAKAETLESMRTTIGLASLKDDEIRAAFKSSTEQLLQDHEFTLAVANRLYVNGSFPLRPSFQNDVKEIFHAEVHSVDFKHNAKEVRRTINSFVKEATHDLIPQILNSPPPPDTVLALVNALYFKGDWVKKMKELPDLPQQFNAFTCQPTQPIVTHQNVSWLRVSDHFNFTNSTTLQASLVELPYQGNEMSNQKASLIVMLPWEQHQCDFPGWVKQHLKWSTVLESIKASKETLMRVTMPKFEIDSEFELSQVLPKLGMARAFSDSANFSGIAELGESKLKIDKVIHKAKMTVDENGTEAAAANVVLMSGVTSLMYPPEKTPLFVDRSFVAVIVVRQSDGSIVPMFSSIVTKI